MGREWVVAAWVAGLCLLEAGWGSRYWKHLGGYRGYVLGASALVAIMGWFHWRGPYPADPVNLGFAGVMGVWFWAIWMDRGWRWAWGALPLGYAAAAIRMRLPLVASHAGMLSGWIPEAAGMAIAATVATNDAMEAALLAMGAEWCAGILASLARWASVRERGYPWNHADLTMALTAAMMAWILRATADALHELDGHSMS